MRLENQDRLMTAIITAIAIAVFFLAYHLMRNYAG